MVAIFSDTSHADCPITKRSTGGYVVFLFGSLLLIRSFRLSCVTTSTTQSEYYMMSAATAEAIYLMELYNKNILPALCAALEIEQENITQVPIVVSKLTDETIKTLNSKAYPMISERNKMVLFGDNASANLIANSGPKKNSKHSLIHASWIWDALHSRGIIEVRKVHTKKNPSDITTKQDGMNWEVFEYHTSILLGENQSFAVDINHVEVFEKYTNLLLQDQLTKREINLLQDNPETDIMIAINNAEISITMINDKPLVMSTFKNKDRDPLPTAWAKQ